MKNRGPLLAVKTKLQGQLLWLVFLSMAIPTLILGAVVLLLLEFPAVGTTSEDVRVSMMLTVSVLFPLLAAVFFCWAFYLTNRLVGPVDRMIQELDARARGTAAGPIILRPKDLLLPLAEKINLIIAEWEKLKKEQGQGFVR